MNEKFKALFEKLNADEELAVKLLAQETAEGAQAVLKEAGFEFSDAEVMELSEVITKIAAQNEKGDLSDDDLEGVAGGFIFGPGPIGGIGNGGPRIPEPGNGSRPVGPGFGGPGFGGPIIGRPRPW